MSYAGKIKKGIVLAALAGCSNNVEPDLGVKNCILNFPSDPVLAPYVSLLQENPPITNSIDFCNTSKDFQQTLWEKIRLAEKTSNPPMAPAPASFDSVESEQYFIDLTREEAEEIYAAQVAHNLWLDKQNVVPWKLVEYDQSELQKLLGAETRFWTWLPKEGKFEIGYLMNNSPAETYSVVNQIVDFGDLANQKSALQKILISLRKIRHGDENFCKDPIIIKTVQQMFEDKISQFGCQSTSPYFVELANSLNIPGETHRGYYGGVGHRGVSFELTNQVLAHGDDVYGSYLMNTPSEEVWDSYEYWEKEIFNHPIYSGIDSEAAFNSKKHEIENSVTHIAKGLLRSYCIDGRARLDKYFGEYLNQEEIDALEQKIILISENCNIYPKDNPDGTGSYENMCHPGNN
jgi:hypothetical protein